MKSVIKKSLAVVLALTMLLSMLAVSGFAAPVAADKDDNEPCEHNNATSEVVAATCGSWGGTWHFCQTEGCGDYWVTDLVKPTGDHDFEHTIEKATCDTPSYITRACKNCGYTLSKTEYGPALGHNYVTVVDKKADCTNPGEWTQMCDRVNPDGTVCGHLNPDNKDASDLPAWGHAHSLNEVEYKAPTCTTMGWVIVTCSNEGCDQDFGDEDNKIYIEATGHHVASTEIDACTATGKMTVYYCDNKITDDKGHVQYDAEGNALICGLLFNSNSVNDPREDGKTLAELIAEGLTHSWVNIAAGETVTVTPAQGTTPAVTEPAYYAGNCDPDDFKKGWQWKECSVCGEQRKFGLTAVLDESGEEVPVDVHHLDYEVLETVPARCANTLTGGVFTKGYQRVQCKVCDTVFKTNWREPAHTFSNKGTSSVVLPPVYAAKHNETDEYVRENGEIKFYPDAASVPANHTAEIWFVQQEKACGQNGIYTHGCEICGFIEMEIHVSNHTEITETEWATLGDGSAATYAAAKALKHVDATCTTGAYDMAYCSVCFTWYKVTASETAPLGHASGTDPQTGNLIRIPLVNGKPVGVIVGMKSADCDEDGWLSYEKCYDPNCPSGLYANVSAVPAGKVLPALGHDYSEAAEYRVPVDANCTWGSAYVAGCKRCGIGMHEDAAYAGYTIDNLAIAGTYDATPNLSKHVWNEVQGTAVEPTCAAQGQYADKQCSVCGDVQDGAIRHQLNADWKTRTVAPTCIADGYILTYCKNCEDQGTLNAAGDGPYHASSKEYNAPATGVHMIAGGVRTWDAALGGYRWDLTNATPATGADAHAAPVAGQCGSPRQQHVNNYVCSGCNVVMEFKVDLAHTSNGVTDCTQNEICTVCTATLRAAAANHNWVLSDDETKTFDPDCLNNGQETYTCTCGVAPRVEVYVPASGSVAEKNAHLKALGHNPEEGKTATCETGVECTRCDALAIQPTDHKDAQGNPVVGVPVAATCQTNAYVKYTCANENCDRDGYWEVETPNSTVAHSYVSISVSRPVNCLLFGVTVMVCEYCDEDAYGEDFVGALGHDLADIKVEATCEKDGLYYTECQRAGCGQAHADDVDHNGKKAYVVTDTPEAHGHKHLEPVLDENGDPVLDENDDPTYTEILFFFNCLDENLQAAGEEGLTCVNPDCDKIGPDPVKPNEYKYADSHDYSKTLSTATCQQNGLEYYYCRTCLEKVILGEVPVQEHNLVVVNDKSKNPTITEKGYLYYECSWKCGVHSVVEQPALPGINVSGSIANIYAIEGVDYSETIVNGGMIAYTIKLTAAEENIYSVTMSVKYDTSKLEYVTFELPEGGNFFGEGTTFAGSAVGSDTVTVYAFNQNSVDKQVVDATLSGVQEFVTLYFYVKADVLDDTISTSTVSTGISIVENSISIFDVEEDAPSKIEVTQAANVTVYKLGDVNLDGVINSNDALAVRKNVLSNTYDAQADINVDGIVDGDDLQLVMQYIINTLDYSGFGL